MSDARPTEYLNVLVDGQSVPLGAEKVTIGKGPDADIIIDDPTVSRLHAVIERMGHAHSIADLGSRNGTVVNGERIFGQRVLKPGDEIKLGRSRIIYRASAIRGSETEPVEPAPYVTPRERDVLVELCRPLAAGTVFTEPTSAVNIARALVISEAAVRMHLSRLYDKFGIDETAPDRRAALASAAIERGVVGAADLEA